MGKSLKAKFNGSSGEVLEYVKTWGIWKAMDKYDVRDYIAMSRWVKEETGDETFGLHPTLVNSNAHSCETAYHQLVEAVVQKILNLDGITKRLEQENEKLRLEVEYLRADNYKSAEAGMQAILQACKS